MTRDHQQFDPKAAGHEDSSVNMGVVIASGVGLAALVLVSFVLMWILWTTQVRHDERIEDQPIDSLGRPTKIARLPDSPPLNADQTVELRKLRESQQAMLDSYKWLDESDSIARIPIDRAMQIIDKNGLPEPKGPVVPAGGQTQ